MEVISWQKEIFNRLKNIWLRYSKLFLKRGLRLLPRKEEAIEEMRRVREKKRIMRSKLIYEIGRLTEEKEYELNFKDGLSRSVEERIELGFVPIRLPVIEDKPYRVFDSMEEYRIWCNKTLPKWLGYYND